MDQPRFSIGEAFHYGWEKTINNLGFMLAAIVLVIVIQAAFAYAQIALEDAVFLLLIMTIASAVVGVVVEMGFLKIALKVYDGLEPDFSDLFGHFHLFLYYFAAGLLYGVMVIFGLILFIIPGIMLAVQFYFAFYFIVDKEMGPITALDKGSALSRGSRWDIFVFFLAVIVLNILGFLCTRGGINPNHPHVPICNSLCVPEIARRL